jgi:5-formyltetrahydrofolate cyclo-ligase
VHCYWPQAGTHEVDTRPLIGALRAANRSIVLPVVTSYDPETPEMAHHRYEGRRALTPNQWGIPEPTDTPAVSPSALDLVVVPALGVGRNGHRIGHGGGYYDAFLADVAAPKVVLSYEDCVVDAIPGASHDVPVTAIVTEHTIYDVPS